MNKDEFPYAEAKAYIDSRLKSTDTVGPMSAKDFTLLSEIVAVLATRVALDQVAKLEARVFRLETMVHNRPIDK